MITLKNITHRNVGLVGNRPATGGLPKRLTVPALSTVSFTEDEMRGLTERADDLIEAGVIVLVEDKPKPKLSKKTEDTKKGA